jgi:CRISPR/Cas system-associated exonuclease Cas4 (RecB family)
MTQEIVGIPTLITLSASKLKTYSACPRKFYYEYMDRQESEKHPAAALGTAVHKTIEKVYREQTDPAVTFLATFDTETAEFDETVDLRKYKTDGIKMVSNYKFERRTPVHFI